MAWSSDYFDSRLSLISSPLYAFLWLWVGLNAAVRWKREEFEVGGLVLSLGWRERSVGGTEISNTESHLKGTSC